jgi:RNA polymerase primary sigma factor
MYNINKKIMKSKDNKPRKELLTEEEEKRLLRICKEGNSEQKKEAMQKLFEHNQGLVFDIVNRYIHYSVDKEDLIQEANYGLLLAIENFDFSKNTRFSTYATWWIRSKVQKYASQNRQVMNIPYVSNFELKKLNKFEKEFEKTHQKKPTTEEIQEALNVSKKWIKRLRKYSKLSVISLEDQTTQKDETLIFEDIVLDQREVSIEEEVIEKERIEILQNLISKFSSREQDIINMFLGLNGYTPKTVEDIALMYGLTTMRVRQIVNQVIEQIKAMIEEKEL